MFPSHDDDRKYVEEDFTLTLGSNGIVASLLAPTVSIKDQDMNYNLWSIVLTGRYTSIFHMHVLLECCCKYMENSIVLTFNFICVKCVSRFEAGLWYSLIQAQRDRFDQNI